MRYRWLVAMLVVSGLPVAAAEPGRPVADAIRAMLPPGSELTTAPLDDAASGLERVRISLPGGRGPGGGREVTVERIATEGTRLDGAGRFAGAELLRLEGYALTGGPSARVEADTVTVEDAGVDALALLAIASPTPETSMGRLAMGKVVAESRRGRRLSIDGVEIAAVDRGVARGFVATAARMRDRQAEVAIERIEVPVIDAPRILSMVGLYARMAEDPTEAPEVASMWQLTEGRGSAKIEGVEMTRIGDAAPVARIERIAAGFEQDQVASGHSNWDVQGLTLDYTQFGERAATAAAALGVDDQPIDIVIRYTNDPAGQRSTLDRLRIDVGRALGVEAQGEVGAVPPTPLNRRMNVMTYAMASMQVPLRRLSLRVEDGGVVGRAIRLWAAMTDVTADDAIVQAEAMAANALLPWRSRAGEAKVDAVLAALDGFLRRSGSLTLTLAPREPLSLATVATAVAAQPELLLDGVEVVHEPPS